MKSNKRGGGERGGGGRWEEVEEEGGRFERSYFSRKWYMFLEKTQFFKLVGMYLQKEYAFRLCLDVEVKLFWDVVKCVMEWFNDMCYGMIWPWVLVYLSMYMRAKFLIYEFNKYVKNKCILDKKEKL